MSATSAPVTEWSRAVWKWNLPPRGQLLDRLYRIRGQTLRYLADDEAEVLVHLAAEALRLRGVLDRIAGLSIFEGGAVDIAREAIASTELPNGGTR